MTTQVQLNSRKTLLSYFRKRQRIPQTIHKVTMGTFNQIAWFKNKKFHYCTPNPKLHMMLTVTIPIHPHRTGKNTPSRTPRRMGSQQIAKAHAQTPRIHIHVQALRLCQLDAPHDARVAVTPAVVFGLVLQPCTRLTALATGTGVFAIVCLRYRSARLVAAGRVYFTCDDTHVAEERWSVLSSGWEDDR